MHVQYRVTVIHTHISIQSYRLCIAILKLARATHIGLNLCQTEVGLDDNAILTLNLSAFFWHDISSSEVQYWSSCSALLSESLI